MGKSTLTKEQQTIVNSVIEEFTALNIQTNTVNDSVIGRLFEQANSYVNERNLFYAQLEHEKKLFVIQRDSFKDGFLKKLKKLFKGYDIDYMISDNSIRVAVKKLNERNEMEVMGHSSFFISIHNSSEIVKFDKSSDSFRKLINTSATIDGKDIYLDDFEETVAFQEAVVKMFKYAL